MTGQNRDRIGSDRAKRLFDLSIASIALVLSLPLQVVLGLLVRINLGTPVLFRQMRPGLDGKPFELLKFRTMRPVDIEHDWVDDASRLTAFGRVLRGTSCDELPTLWNVVRGDMSLVGPRPLLMDYLDLYSEVQRQRHNVRPGLTGLAQVSGRNALSWDDRLRLDVEYVHTRSMALDLRILMRTVVAVLRREGITAEGEATMSRFTGHPGTRSA